MLNEADQDNAANDEASAKPSIVLAIVLFVGLSVVAVGIGYFLGGLLHAGNTNLSAEVQLDEGKKSDSAKEEGAPGNGDHEVVKAADTILLEPLIITLPKSANTWIRLELAVVTAAGSTSPDLAAQAKLLSEIAKYMRESDMTRLYGPSGYLHLQDDLLDISRRSTGGGIQDLLILSMVSE